VHTNENRIANRKAKKTDAKVLKTAKIQRKRPFGTITNYDLNSHIEILCISSNEVQHGKVHSF